MTIGIDARPLLESRGGVAEYTRHLITSMIACAPQHEYVLYTSSHTRLSRAFNNLVSSTGPCRNVHVPISNKILNACTVLVGRPYLDRLIESLGAVNLDCLWCPNGNFLSLSKKVPLIVTLHDVSFAIEASWFSTRQRLWHQLVNFQKILGTAARIIAVSQKTKEDLETFFGVDPSRVTVIPLGIADPGAVDPGVELDADLPENYILCFGVENVRKNAECLVDALARMRSVYPNLRDVRLVLVQTEAGSLRSLRRQIRIAGLQDVCLIRGPLSESERSTYYSRATLLAYPSLYEGFGLPPFEAAHYGIPSIVSSVASLPETAGDFSLLVNPHDSTSIANGLGALLIDERLRTHCIERGHRARNRLTWDAAAAATLSVFEMAQVLL